MCFKYLKKAAALLLLCAFMLAASIVNASAADTSGSITVKLNEVLEGIELRLYDVADYINGEYVLNSDFGDSGVSFDGIDTSEAAQSLAEELKAYALDNSLSGVSAIVDSDGNASFTALEINKLYLIVEPDESDDYQVQPMLTTVPYISGNTASYDVSLDGKYIDSKIFSQSAVILNKTGDDNKPLEGAVFKFQAKTYYTDSSEVSDGAETGSDSDGNYYWKDYGSDLTTNSVGQIVVKKLPFGTYRFVEVQAPAGYVLDSTPHEFTLSKHGSVKLQDDGKYVLRTGTVAELDITNEPESSIPTSTPTSTPTSSTPSTTVKTSDDSNTAPYMIALCLAGLLIFAAIKSYSLKKDR